MKWHWWKIPRLAKRKMAGTFLFFLFSTVVYKSIHVEGLQLKQVLVLSRHNVRTPLIDGLERMSPKKIPKWSEKTGQLTAKGALLESYMGEYFYAWLNKEQLLLDGCPNKESVHIYANTRQRTKDSAKAFTKAAFRDCNVIVHYKNIKEMDPVFNPIIHNESNAFKHIVLNDMQKKINEIKLNDAFLELDKIIEFKNSTMCKTDYVCDLIEEKNKIVYKVGEEPNVNGPLAIGNAITDLFMMSYYNGMDLDNVAWGMITKTEQWRLLMDINRELHNIRFNTTTLAQDASKPLLKYISGILNDDKAPKFTLLMGHDSNIYTILAAMGFRPYDLHDQYEKTPVGGKLVFQKWHDEVLNVDLLKVNYVYQTVEQLREGLKLSLDKPPQSVLMTMENCPIDENGFCLWSDFEELLKNLVT